MVPRGTPQIRCQRAGCRIRDGCSTWNTESRPHEGPVGAWVIRYGNGSAGHTRWHEWTPARAFHVELSSARAATRESRARARNPGGVPRGTVPRASTQGLPQDRSAPPARCSTWNTRLCHESGRSPCPRLLFHVEQGGRRPASVARRRRDREELHDVARGTLVSTLDRSSARPAPVFHVEQRVGGALQAVSASSSGRRSSSTGNVRSRSVVGVPRGRTTVVPRGTSGRRPLQRRAPRPRTGAMDIARETSG